MNDQSAALFMQTHGRLFEWQEGRKRTGYRRMLLAVSERLRCDAWLLDYPKGSRIERHTDPVDGRRHYRLNLVLWGPQNYVGDALFRLGPLVIFRPDVMPHGVRLCDRRRIVLSLGVAA